MRVTQLSSLGDTGSHKYSCLKLKIVSHKNSYTIKKHLTSTLGCWGNITLQTWAHNSIIKFKKVSKMIDFGESH